MGLNTKEFECFEQQFIELVSEFQLLCISTSQMRETLRAEAASAEAAQASRDASERASSEAQADGLAAKAAATQAAKSLADMQDKLTTAKMQQEYTDRQRRIFEEKYIQMTDKVTVLEKELQNLRPLQAANMTLQRQFIELKECIHKKTEEAQSEASRLENELRKVEKSASAGTVLRERARLAAAAHARDRRLAAAELQHTSRELQNAYAEITRQRVRITELECRLSKSLEDNKKMLDPDLEAVTEVRTALKAERAGTERLEKALAKALADNANLAAELHKNDNKEINELSQFNVSTNIRPIDSFLAE